MKSNLYHGYTAEQIFKDADEEKRVLEMKEVEREEYIAERVMKLKTEDERQILYNEKKNKKKNNKNKKNKKIKKKYTIKEKKKK